MKLFLIVFFATIYGIVKSQQAGHSIRESPEACICQNTFCRRKGKNLVCRGVAVDCFGKNLTLIPEGIPLNVTGLRLSNNSIHHINFGDFAKFTRLTNLIINDNNATELSFGNPVKRLQKLSLAGNHLTNLPSTSLLQFKRLIDLNLQNNRIQDLRYIKFPRKLEMLNLNNNQIRYLVGGTFNKLKQLRVLKLNNNTINRLLPKAFVHLSQLETLEMEHNQLRKLTKDVFTSLSQGWYLNLKNNRITDIHSLAFRLFGYKNENHHQIHLENNKLPFIDQEIVGILIPRKKRYSLYFGGNPVFCDCNLIELRKNAGELLGDKNRMICDSPRNFTGVTVHDLHIAECCY